MPTTAFRLLPALCALLAVFAASPAAAQTLFAWPDTAVDLAAYSTIEECEAATGRVRAGAATDKQLASAIWQDTMPLDPREWLEPLPVPVVETIRRCLTRFAAVDSVPLADFPIFLPLYLNAGWDAKARMLVERRLAVVPPSAQRELVAVIGRTIQIYLGIGNNALRVQSLRRSLIEEIVLEHVPRVADRGMRLRIYFQLIPHRGIASGASANDTASVRRAVSRVLALADSVSDSELATILKEQGFGDADGSIDLFHLVIKGGEMQMDRMIVDSLRRSTAAFVALKRNTWVLMTGLPAETYGRRQPIRLPPETYDRGEPLDERAPTLEGDIWLGRGDSEGARPSRGRVSLVVFFSNRECRGVVDLDQSMYESDACASTLATLHRLAKRFPALEITIVAQTHGFFTYVNALTPAKEAEWTKQWLESYGVDAPLTMTIVDYARLPDPDGRRLNRVSANHSTYAFGLKRSVRHGFAFLNGSAFLIDDGTILESVGLDRSSEPYLAELIEILLDRRSNAK